jgi:hypothetical protein
VFISDLPPPDIWIRSPTSNPSCETTLITVLPAGAGSVNVVDTWLMAPVVCMEMASDAVVPSELEVVCLNDTSAVLVATPGVIVAVAVTTSILPALVELAKAAVDT